jgi:hypothetical protein
LRGSHGLPTYIARVTGQLEKATRSLTFTISTLASRSSVAVVARSEWGV